MASTRNHLLARADHLEAPGTNANVNRRSSAKRIVKYNAKEVNDEVGKPSSLNLTLRRAQAIMVKSAKRKRETGENADVVLSDDEGDSGAGRGLSGVGGGAGAAGIGEPSQVQNSVLATVKRSKLSHLFAKGSAAKVGKVVPPSTKSPKELLLKEKEKARKVAEREAAQAETAEWKKKYRKAIRGFHFYFDRVDDATEKAFVKAIDELGGHVEGFFSTKNVTHVITGRSLRQDRVLSPLKLSAVQNVTPPLKQKDANLSSARSASRKLLDDEGNVGLARRAKTSDITPAPGTGGVQARWQSQSHGKIPGLGSDPFAPPDVLTQAEEAGIKIWNVTKLENVLSRLLPSRSPAKAAISSHIPTLKPPTPKPPIPKPPTPKLPKAAPILHPHPHNKSTRPSLPALLRQEALTGVTYERDPTVLREDFHYFPEDSFYVLVEDASGEHKTIAAKEYAAPKDDDDPEWPVLWGGADGKSAFYKCKGQEIDPPPQPKIPRRPSVSRQGGRVDNCTPATVAKVDQALGAVGSLKAKGAAIQANAGGALGGPGLSLRRSVSLNQLHKRFLAEKDKNVQPDTKFVRPGDLTKSLKNATANTQKGSARRQNHDGGASFLGASGNSISITSNIASMTSAAPLPPKGTSAGLVDPRLRRLVDRPGLIKRSLSVDAGLRDKEWQDRQKTLKKKERGREKKSGYCENCRLKFDDFKEHVLTKKHRKFALSPRKWEELDELIVKLARPLRPDLQKAYEQSMEAEGIPEKKVIDYGDESYDSVDSDADEDEYVNYVPRITREQFDEMIEQLDIWHTPWKDYLFMDHIPREVMKCVCRQISTERDKRMVERWPNGISGTAYLKGDPHKLELLKVANKWWELRFKKMPWDDFEDFEVEAEEEDCEMYDEDEDLGEEEGNAGEEEEEEEAMGDEEENMGDEEENMGDDEGNMVDEDGDVGDEEGFGDYRLVGEVVEMEEEEDDVDLVGEVEE